MVSYVSAFPSSTCCLDLSRSSSFLYSSDPQFNGLRTIKTHKSSSSFLSLSHPQSNGLQTIKTHKSSFASVKTQTDLKLICTIPEKCHPEIGTIRELGHSWFRRYIQSPPLEAADFASLMLSMAPQGNLEGATNLLKFCLFVVPFDDHLDHFLENSEQLMNMATEILEGKDMKSFKSPLPFMEMFEDFCRGVRNHATEVQWKRFVKNFRLYLEGVKEQENLKVASDLEPPSIPVYMRIRNKVTAIHPEWCLLPQMLGVEVDDEIWNHESLVELMRLVSDHHVVVNDVMSFHKDDGLMWNLTSILIKSRGCSMREAVAVSCTIAEQIEHEFLHRLHELKASDLVRNQNNLLTFLDLLPFQISGHLTWLARNPSYGSHLLTKEGQHNTVYFQDLV